MPSRLSDLAAEATHVLESGTPSDAELVDSIEVLGRLRRQVDAALVRQAGELESRSEPGTLDSPPAERGYRSAQDLIRHVANVDPADASRLARLGAALAPRISLTGESLPPRYPHLGGVVADGSIGVDAAAKILDTLEELAPRVSTDQLHYADAALAAVAPTLTSAQVRVACERLKATLDPDGAEPDEEALREKAFLTLRQQPNGMTAIRGLLDPVQAGFVSTALDARTAPRRSVFTDAGAAVDIDDADGGDGADHRSTAARRADALVDLAAASLVLDEGTVAGSPVSVVVTMTLDQLLGAGGVARIDGVEQPISAGTARRLAAGASLIPAVLGTDSEPLDLGRRARLATTAQRRALGLRDEGCIWGHCDSPPGRCEVAHLTAWATGGPTDLDNLALMCRFHHTLFDTHGWRLLADHHGRWLLPPRHVDPTQTPVRAGPIPQFA